MAENIKFLKANDWYTHDGKWRNDNIMKNIPDENYGVDIENALLLQERETYRRKFRIVNISDVKINPNNPRLIKDDKFNKLVKSIQEFPQMLEIRPIVVNGDMIVLGGNMRLKACQEAGLKEVPIIIADNLTEEQQREFLIKDNVSGGEWDWDLLANEWDTDLLEEWGLDVKFPVIHEDEEEPEEKTYIPVFRFEVTCKTESEKNKLMADLLLKGFNCTEDY